MTTTTFKTKTEPAKPTEFKKSEDNSTHSVVNDVEVPYTSYESEKGNPYTVDHFKLGEFWSEDNVFTKDIDSLEGYINKKIEKGEWANNKDVVKKELQKMEKLIDVKDEVRPVVKISKMVAYIDFLKETDSIMSNFGKYNRHGRNK